MRRFAELGGGVTLRKVKLVSVSADCALTAFAARIASPIAISNPCRRVSRRLFFICSTCLKLRLYDTERKLALQLQDESDDTYGQWLQHPGPPWHCTPQPVAAEMLEILRLLDETAVPNMLMGLGALMLMLSL